MTASKPSRATLESLLELIDATDWPYLVKRDVKSSVRTVARFIGADMADIEVDVSALRRRLEGLSPEAFGLTKGRWNNIRSLFGKTRAVWRRSNTRPCNLHNRGARHEHLLCSRRHQGRRPTVTFIGLPTRK